VLFVSHNLPAVTAVSDWAVLLEHGTEAARGSALDVVREYYELLMRAPTAAGNRPADTGELAILDTRIVDAEGRERYEFAPGETAAIEVGVRAERDTPNGILGCRADREGIGVVAGWGGLGFYPEMKAGEALTLRIELDLHLAPGDFSLTGVVLRADQSAVMVSGVLARWSVRDTSAAPELGVAAVHPRVTVR
jgi:hypothetical protein